MKRSMAMMACVLSGALMLGSFTPVLAETEVKSVSTATADAKKDDAKADTTDKKDDAKNAVLEDGTYSAEFDTDSGMFHVNEANDQLHIPRHLHLLPCLQCPSDRNDCFCRMCDDGGTLLCTRNRSCRFPAGASSFHADSVSEIQRRQEHCNGVYATGICI